MRLAKRNTHIPSRFFAGTTASKLEAKVKGSNTDVGSPKSGITTKSNTVSSTTSGRTSTTSVISSTTSGNTSTASWKNPSPQVSEGATLLNPR